MPREKREEEGEKEKAEEEEEDEVEGNVFKLTILLPVIQYLKAFTEFRHNLSPDEFLKAIYLPEKANSTPCLKAPCYTDSCVILSPEKLSKKLQVPKATLQKPIAKLFFEIIRLRDFLTDVVSEFGKREKYHRPRKNVSQTIVIIYVLIYRSAITFVEDAISCLIHFDATRMINLISFLLTNELPTWFYVAGCKLFDVDFVDEKILNPFLEAVPVLQTLFANLTEIKRPKVMTKKVTVPLEMNVLKHPKRAPDPPVCTPEHVSKIPIQPVPKTLYKMPKIDSKIADLRLEHRAQAAQLLQDANAKAPACLGRKKSKRYERVLEEIARENLKNQFFIRNAGKIPEFKNMLVKKTVTTILREEAIIANSEVKEVEKLQELIKGSFNPGEVQGAEEEIRRYEREENLRKIEEKHLAGLISYEESLLAKQNVMREAQERGNRVRLEREELNAKLEKYRQEEMEKLKKIVEKSHDAEQAVKNAYDSMVKEKRNKAAEVAEESRRIKDCLLKNKEEELQKKLEIINEIKSFQPPQGVRVREFEPTETKSLGLLCEMSLVELKEKLLIAKEKWHDELIARNEEVKKRREKQKDLVECARKTIEEYRVFKQSFPPRASSVCDTSNVLKTPKLEALRQKLEERRMKRLQKIN